MNTCTWCGDTIETGIDNQHRCKPDREPMSFFNELPEEARKKAMENVAYELLEAWWDAYIDEGDMVEKRLIESLKGERFYHYLYLRWKDTHE